MTEHTPSAVLSSRVETTNKNIFLFCEPIKPLSVNKAFVTHRKGVATLQIKSGEYKRFKTDVLDRLGTDKYLKRKQDFLAFIAPLGKRFQLRTALKIFTPKDIFFTVDGDVSSRAGDVSNYRKPIQDIIFEFLGVDDKYSKLESNEQVPDDINMWALLYEIEIIKR